MDTNRPDLFLVAETAAERQARVDQIRNKIDSDRYEVPPLEVADAIYAFFSRALAGEGTVDPDDPGAAR